MFSLYIIYSPKLDKYYVGHTRNMSTRLEQHNAGISTFTAKANDWVLKFRKEFPTRQLALQAEMAISKKCIKVNCFIVKS